MKDQHQHRPCSSSSVSVSGKKKRKEFAESSSGGNNNNNNIGRTCTECGKIFWSWKALFGHMRCHPERRWRGINPPPNFRRQQPHPFTPEEQDCASSLILLSNAKPNKNKNKNKAVATTTVDDSSVQFVCSCCNKVFGSHQALGGHRASHKNVKGCFANTTITASSVDHDHDHHPIIMVPQTQTQTRDGYNNVGGNVEGEALGGHKCSICLRVFNTGQALGGHKRCHWEKGETTTPTIPFDSSSTATATATANATTFNNKSSRVNVVDLNFPLPPPPPHHHHHSSSPLTLDLRG